jgi:hypothetical protein
MMRRVRRGLSTILVSILLTHVPSCVRPAQPEVPTAADVSNAELDVLWDASLRVLARIDMQPDRQDRAIGVIETLPTTTKQIWEFWREDCADAYSQTLADLQTIQRRATVRFKRLPTEGRWQVDVQVDVYRLQRPERQFTSTSSTLEAFSSLLPTTGGEIVGRAEASYLEPLGRDAALEQRILTMILRQSGTTDYQYPEYPDTQVANSR